jgi:hypothetical protein
MQQLKWMLNGALVTLAFCLIVSLTILVFSEMQPVRADLVIRPAVTTVDENMGYLWLTDAPLQRDITVQRFAPLEVNQ